MDNELEQMIKRKNAYLKRIEENKRMMELINNPHVKDNSLRSAKEVKRNLAVIKIQVIRKK